MVTNPVKGFMFSGKLGGLCVIFRREFFTFGSVCVVAGAPCLFFWSIREYQLPPRIFSLSFSCVFAHTCLVYPHGCRLNAVGVVLSSPVIQSALPTETEQADDATPVAESTNADVSSATQPENHVIQAVSEPNHIVKVTEPNEDIAKPPFLGVSSIPMGRSSR